MKTIGLIGGMSWESSVHYYRLINEGVRARVGGIASAPLVLHSFDFAEIAAMQTAGEWAGLGERLADVARGLQGAGAQAMLICANTMHKVAPAVEAATPAQLLHIADPLAAALLAGGHRKVGLLGTRFVMNEPFYADRLAERGLETIVPPTSERVELDRIIFQELVAGELREESREYYRRVMDGLAAQGADAIALACTELGLLVGPQDSTLPLFDTTELHAGAAVDFILS